MLIPYAKMLIMILPGQSQKFYWHSFHSKKVFNQLYITNKMKRFSSKSAFHVKGVKEHSLRTRPQLVVCMNDSCPATMPYCLESLPFRNQDQSLFDLLYITHYKLSSCMFVYVSVIKSICLSTHPISTCIQLKGTFVYVGVHYIYIRMYNTSNILGPSWLPGLSEVITRVK